MGGSFSNVEKEQKMSTGAILQLRVVRLAGLDCRTSRKIGFAQIYVENNTFLRYAIPGYRVPIVSKIAVN